MGPRVKRPHRPVQKRPMRDRIGGRFENSQALFARIRRFRIAIRIKVKYTIGPSAETQSMAEDPGKMARHPHASWGRARKPDRGPPNSPPILSLPSGSYSVFWMNRFP